jgi:hypothetical protein
MRVRPWSRWVNDPITNPTQNRFRRGLPGASGELSSVYSEISDEFQRFMNDGLKTSYDRYLKPMGNPFYGGN